MLQMDTNNVSQRGTSVSGLKQQVNVPKSPALTEPVIHSGSSGREQLDLKSVTVVLGENSQMAITARTSVTIQEVTNMAITGLTAEVEERSSALLVYFFN